MIKRLIQLTILTALALSLMACTSPQSLVVGAISGNAPVINQDAQQENFQDETVQESTSLVQGSVNSGLMQSEIESIPASELTVDEINGLLFMREEEKLAHDVYLTLYEKWGMNVFQNIAQSEQTHTDAIQVLLDRYELVDPTVGKGIGEFSDPALQTLYDQLISQGSQSLADALKVGAAIEEIDILDLRDKMAQTLAEDILLTYQNLEKGSNNHLRSFTGILLTQTGETYQPQYLSLEAYQEIVNSNTATSGFGRGNGNGQGAGGGRKQ